MDDGRQTRDGHRTPNVVLVTGVSRHLGSRVAARLAARPEVERVIGVDTIAPSPEFLKRLGRTEFVRVDIRNPLIAKVITAAEVDTVVHMSVQPNPSEVGGRASMKELNVIGTMQLLAACQKAPALRRVVLRSSTAVYGYSARNPALFTESTPPRSHPSDGYAKDATEVEGYLRGFARRRPDVETTVLRLANILSHHFLTPLSRYFMLPIVPTVLGFDARLQFLHLEDAIDVFERVICESHPGTFNVAGPGALLLSQAIRRAGRVALPIPDIAAPLVGLFLRQAGALDFTPEHLRLLNHGQVVSVDKLRRECDMTPRYGSVEAFDDFVRASDLASVISPDNLQAVEKHLLRRFAALSRSL